MVTSAKTEFIAANRYRYQYVGLSTDAKPASTINAVIANGSTFYEMDTADLHLYDEANTSWIKQ